MRKTYCSRDQKIKPKFKPIDEFFKNLNHLRLVEEVNRIIARKDKEFVDQYFDTYDKSVIVKDGE